MWNDCISFHILMISVGIALFDFPPLFLAKFSIGLRRVLWGLFYHLLTVFVCISRKNFQWLDVWAFAAITSIFQVIPDLFLANELGTIVFPNDGLDMFRFDLKKSTDGSTGVTFVFCMLWTIPISVPILFGVYLLYEWKCSRLLSTFAVMILSMFIIYTDEFSQPFRANPLYIATSKVKHQWAGVAVYVLIAEMILGLSSFMIYDKVARGTSFLCKVSCGAMVAILYTGSLAVAYLFVESV